MEAELDPTQRRIIGVLIEKALTTPDSYPLTVNALVAGCNQKSNRDPVMQVQDFEVEGALRALFVREWVTNTNAGGRAIKWRHRIDHKLGLEGAPLAVLAELLLRGPQQPGELRARAARMAPIATQEDLLQVLQSLMDRLPPLVTRIPRRPGERADRYGQTLAEDAGREEDSEAPPRQPLHRPPPSRERRPSKSASPPWSARSRPCGTGSAASPESDRSPDPAHAHGSSEPESAPSSRAAPSSKERRARRSAELEGAPRFSRPTRRGPRVGRPAAEPRCAHGDHVRSAERISALRRGRMSSRARTCRQLHS